MKKTLTGLLVLFLIAALLTACGPSPAAPSEPAPQTTGAAPETAASKPAETDLPAAEPLTQEGFEELLRSLGYDPQRVPEDDLDTVANFYVEEAKAVPNAASSVEAPGFECQLFRFDGEVQARVYADGILAGIDPNVYAVTTEEGPVWTRHTADGGEGESYTLLLAGDVLLRFSSYTEEGAAAAASVLAALEDHD